MSDGGDRTDDEAPPAGEIQTDLDIDLEPDDEEEPDIKLEEIDEIEPQGGTGPKKVVAERGVDEVFAEFEEDSPEEIIESAEDEDDQPRREDVEDDVESFLGGDLSDVETADTSEEESVEDLSAEDLMDRVGGTDGQFVEHGQGGPLEAVGEVDVDAAFEEFEESTPEEVMAAADGIESAAADGIESADDRRQPATTEKHIEVSEADVSMDVGRDRAGGGGPETDREGSPPEETGGSGDDARESELRSALEDVSFDDDDDDGGLGAFVEEDAEMLERADDDRHRVVGDSDVDAVFEEFEESSPEEVIEADDRPAEHPDGQADDADVANLFGDLSAVDVEAEAEPATVESASPEPTPAPDPEETAEEVEGLLDDLAGVDVDAEAAGEVEGLLDDLADVDAEAAETAGTSTSDATAETQETILEPQEPESDLLERAEQSAFQWLGEDVHIFSGEGEVDEMFEEFEDSSPDEIMAVIDAPAAAAPGRSATIMYDELAGSRPPGTTDGTRRAATARGWDPDPSAEASVDVTATAMYDEMATDSPAVVAHPETGADAAEADDGDLDIDLSDPTDSDSESESGPEPADDDGELDLDLSDPTDSDPESEPEPADDDRGDLDIDLDLDDSTDSESDTATASADADADDDDGELDLDLGDPTESDDDLEMDDPAESDDELDLSLGDIDAGDTATAGGKTRGSSPSTDTSAGDTSGGPSPSGPSTSPGTGSPSTSSSPSTPTTGTGGVDDPEAMGGESDVDAVFERFEEDSPEEIIESADDPAADTEAVTVSDATVERLFGDLSEVELEETTPTEPEPSFSAPEPGSEEAKREIEGLLGDLSEIDLEEERKETAPPTGPAAGADAEAGTAAETPSGGRNPSEEMLEQTSEDTHVAVGDSDVDAVFERFEEASPEEVIEAFDLDAPVGASASKSSKSSKSSDRTTMDLDDVGSSVDDGDEIVADANERGADSGPATSNSERVSDALSEDDDQEEEDLFTASSDGPGSETLFPEVDSEDDPDSQDRTQESQSSLFDEDDEDDEEESKGFIGRLVSKILGIF